ncbi:FmdB family zinc ribbon protein [Pseudactinotalea terrae]|uniref:FmdB family zinc ribbon protein n=1 Tax=Pseudactinotalea terrae TaxID=1743262 RepID=UPI0012E0EDC8|nr:FmdB family zinc ribbon protein [Pseudactinotalea terrae]
MPTYAYACTSCGHRFDIYQAFSDDALTECPECGGALRKQFGNVGVVFKGSGFYRNDARGTSSSSSPAEPSSKESGSKESGSTAPAKESKPAKESSSASTASASSSSTSASKAS